MYVTNNNKVVDIFAGSLGTVGIKGVTTFNDNIQVADGKKLQQKILHLIQMELWQLLLTQVVVHN